MNKWRALIAIIVLIVAAVGPAIGMHLAIVKQWAIPLSLFIGFAWSGFWTWVLIYVVKVFNVK